MNSVVTRVNVGLDQSREDLLGLQNGSGSEGCDSPVTISEVNTEITQESMEDDVVCFYLRKTKTLTSATLTK